MKRKNMDSSGDATCSATPELCTNGATDGGIAQQIAVFTTAVFSTMGLGVIALQLDGISRRLLPAPRLLAKRHNEYAYVSEQCCEFNALMMRQHVGGGKALYDPKLETAVWEKLAKGDDDEMEQLIQDILDSKKASPLIVAMEKDSTDDSNPNEYNLYLAFPPTKTVDEKVDISTPSAPTLCRRVRVPMVAFCEKLALAFEERQLTSTALCFLADASSGSGSETLATVVEKCNHGVATINNPAWMSALSLLLLKKNSHNITDENFERIIFSLCRLDAWRVRNSVGTSRTVLFAMPGQACVPLLLPLIQKVFVHERHVFVYDGCCHSVEMGTALRNQYGSSYRQQASKEEWNLVSSTPPVISATFPMAPLRHVREFPEALSKINGVQASTVEAWMASVDTFLDMKSQEKKNFYTPFVCRMGFLMRRSGIGNGSGDLSELALKNVLQYITGSRSRALPKDVMDGAVKALDEVRSKIEEAVKDTKLREEESVLIEKCVFTHKSILIGEKTLLDTVQPKEDWSLKAAKKLKSCMCCAPGEGEEEDEEENEETMSEPGEKFKRTDGIDMSMPGAFASNNAAKSKYVDGKAQFAFDPTMFSK